MWKSNNSKNLAKKLSSIKWDDDINTFFTAYKNKMSYVLPTLTSIGLKPEDFVQTFIYLYCLKKFGDIEKAETIFPNLRYVLLLESDLDPVQKDCYRCHGDGVESCGECAGLGNFTCRTCDGDGVIDCEECEGGFIGDDKCENCDFLGKIDCPDCDGGYIDCDECYDGKIECPDCDGEGIIETDDLFEVRSKLICSWDQSMNNIFEIREGTLEPIEDSDFPNSFVLASETFEGETQMDVLANEIYVDEFMDECPPLKFSKNTLNYKILDTHYFTVES